MIIHQSAHFSQSGGPLQEEHQEVCMHCTALSLYHTREGASKKSDRVSLTEEAMKAFKVLKQANLKTLLAEDTSSEEGKLILWKWQTFTIHQGHLYLCSMPKGKTEDLQLFVVPKAHCVAALNGCHQDACHQGHDCTLCLLWDHFWWPGMTNQVQKSPKSCTHCLQHEGNLPKVPLHPIVPTAPMDLLHIDFTSIKTTMVPNRLPKFANFLTFHDHFTIHVMAYMTPNKTTGIVTKFLYQGYILICGALARLLSNHGMNFMSSIFGEMCKCLGVKKLQMTPYHPQVNGLLDRLVEGLIKLSCGWLGSWEKMKRLTGQAIWQKYL